MAQKRRPGKPAAVRGETARFIESWEEMKRHLRMLHSLTKELEQEIQTTRDICSRVSMKRVANDLATGDFDPPPSKSKKKHRKRKKQ